MAKLTDEIRAAVQDIYGAWAILRVNERRKIRDLCDLCDMFESTCDSLSRKLDQTIWKQSEVNPPTYRGRYLCICEGIRTAVIRVYKGGAWSSMQRVIYWRELPPAPNERKDIK